MPDMGAGIILYEYDSGVASLDFSPQVPNAAVVRRIQIAAPNGDDTWTVKCNGQELGRFPIVSGSSQNVLLPGTAEGGPSVDIFDYCNDVLGVPLIYPVPEGKTLTVFSEGGATADITIAYEEFADSALGPGMTNYPGSKRFLAPVWFSLAAKATAPGEYSFDTEAGLDFVPTLFVKESFPIGWTARILDLFLEGAGVNTYDSSSDAQSTTDHIAAIRSGQRLFTRSAGGGIPLVGSPSATGSANVVLGNVSSPFRPFAAVDPGTGPNLPQPIQYRPGYVCDWRLGVIGSFTGGADYSTALQLAIAEFTGA